MKSSVLQLTVVLCILTVGFMTVVSFTPTADAHDYTVVTLYYNAYMCSHCGGEKYRELVGATSYTASHSGTGSHQSVITSKPCHLYLGLSGKNSATQLRSVRG